MTLPVYPGRDLLPGLAFSSKWSPSFVNMKTATTASGADIDLGLAQYPLHDFELTYEFLRDGPIWGPPTLAQIEFRTLMGFHLAIGGSLGRFLYRNPDDCRSYRNQIGVGDGVTTTFTITRTFGANGYFGTEPVGQVDMNAPINVYPTGSATPLAPSQYTISTATPCANTITFASPPGASQPVYMDMSYFYYCKLSDNSNTFEKFMDRLWKLGKVTLHSCRAGA
jgi:hypothetical protein